MALRPVDTDDNSRLLYPITEVVSAQNFRWVVGGSLGAAGALIGVLFYILLNQFGEMKTEFRSQMTDLTKDLKTYQSFVLDIQGDIRLLSQQSNEQANQIREMQTLLNSRTRR
jgi:hypothetical protein